MEIVCGSTSFILQHSDWCSQESDRPHSKQLGHRDSLILAPPGPLTFTTRLHFMTLFYKLMVKIKHIVNSYNANHYSHFHPVLVIYLLISGRFDDKLWVTYFLPGKGGCSQSKKGERTNQGSEPEDWQYNGSYFFLLATSLSTITRFLNLCKTSSGAWACSENEK